MDLVESVLKAPWFPVLTGLAGYAAGFASDLGKEKFKRRMRLREEHAQEIQREILGPICELLEEFYLPVCRMKLPPLEIADGFSVSMKTPARRGRTGDESWNETGGFKKYFEDALDSHYPGLLRQWQAFSGAYDSMAARAQEHAGILIQRLQGVIGLPPLPAAGAQPVIWANYPRLAILVLHRQIGVEEEGLRVPGGYNEARTSRTQTLVLRCGSAQEAQLIIAAVDRLAQDSAGVTELKALLTGLEADANRLAEDFRSALARKPASIGCRFA